VGRIRVDVDDVDRRVGAERALRIGKRRRVDRVGHARRHRRVLREAVEGLRDHPVLLDDQAVGGKVGQIQRAVAVAMQIVRKRQRVVIAARRVQLEHRNGARLARARRDDE
jgi:hypothetical protein